jgi:hypothetical protein
MADGESHKTDQNPPVGVQLQQPHRPFPNKPHLATDVAISGLTQAVIESPTFNVPIAVSRVGSVVSI